MFRTLAGCVVLALMLAGCRPGHAEFLRRGPNDGELLVKGRGATEDADQKIREACGGRTYSMTRNTVDTGGRKGRATELIHYECNAAVAAPVAK